MSETVSFVQMKDSNREDYDLLLARNAVHLAELPHRIAAGLERLAGDASGFKISRLEHSLQSATRAERDGADLDWIVAALVHDIGDDLAPRDHPEMAASIIRPYVRPEVTWVVSMHGLFQLKYYGHHIGLDPDAREQYRGHEWFDSCERFCEHWDQSSFDPEYPTESLEHFLPALNEVFLRPARPAA